MTLTQEQCTRIWQAATGALGIAFTAVAGFAVWEAESKSELIRSLSEKLTRFEAIEITPEQHQKLVDQCLQNSKDIEQIKAHQQDVMAEQKSHDDRIRALEESLRDRYRKDMPQQ